MSAEQLVQAGRGLVEQLKGSPIYRDYEDAFRETTGLPLRLRAADAFDLTHHGDPKESPFCALMAQSNHSCSACLMVQKRVEEEARLVPKTHQCFAGLYETAIPVRVGEKLIAFLETGQVLLHEPTEGHFTQIARETLKLDSPADLKRVEAAYFQTRVLTARQYQAIVRLLEIFALHLASLSNQFALRTANAEPPAIKRARAYITECHADDLSLGRVAKAVNMSACYFCKMFKGVTGMTFTDYLAIVRVEKVKLLMLNPHVRISEAAFEAGFQSLSQFNRVFRRVSGEAPTGYRDRLHSAGG